MAEIGIMQGRLLPPFEGRFQAFPATNWRDEFARGREAGIQCIEWIYEQPHEEDNPLRTDEGVAEMHRMMEQTGVQVRSICADYYMTRPLVSDAAGIDAGAVEHLCWLMARARMLRITYIVLPFVDISSIRTEQGRQGLVALLRELAPKAQANGVELHLETDFPPQEFVAILAAVDHPFVRCNYDIGNSASLGFDSPEELTALAPWLGSVHVKDRVRGGGTVPLGTGNADLPTSFALIRKAGFQRWFILQVARGEEGDEVAWIAAARRFVQDHLAALEQS